LSRQFLVQTNSLSTPWYTEDYVRGQQAARHHAKQKNHYGTTVMRFDEEQLRALGATQRGRTVKVPIGSISFTSDGLTMECEDVLIRIVIWDFHWDVDAQGVCYCHPYISAEDIGWKPICLGDLTDKVETALDLGDLVGAVSLIRQLLEFPIGSNLDWFCRKHRRSNGQVSIHQGSPDHLQHP
jgi:hypothetical protein